MGIPLRVLIIEDVEDDAELLVQELRSKGYDPLYERVDTQKAMLDALDRQTWDIIICDYSMPGFNAISALELMHKIQNDLPFILVSGTIGEEVAVEAMKAGADDYVMKDNLSRFVPAIQRELVEYKERRRTRQMDEAIQTLVKGTVGVTGQEFFDRIVGSVCEWLGTDCTFIGKISDESHVTALSMQLDGNITYDFGYSLNGESTPCGNVANKGFRIYPEGICKLFPDDRFLVEMGAVGYVGTPILDKHDNSIGIVCAISRHTLNLPPRTAEVMEIIAAKASAEIERMQAEADLQKSEERYRAVFEQAASSNVVIDGNTGDIVEFNTHAHENLGYTRKEFEDLKIVDIDIIENDEEVRKHIEKIMKNGSDIFETKHRGKDGKIHNMIISAKRLSIPGLNFISTQWNDITGRKEAEEQIKKSLREKEVLLKEIHHRVKNNMQIVSSLLNMQSESVDDENTRQILKKSQNRVKSMALVHEKLYQTEDLSSIDFGEYTRSLTTRLLHSFGDTRGVQLKIDMDEVCLDVNKAIPCGLIINEIVTNSFKHAFPDSTTGVDKNKFEGKGVIKVSMRKIEASGSVEPLARRDCELSPEDDPGASHRSDSVGQNAESKSEIRNPKSLAQTAGHRLGGAYGSERRIAPGQAEIIKLVISDNGIGLPEGLDFRHTKTLGMELVITLVDQLDGSIEYVNNGGTEFKITFEV